MAGFDVPLRVVRRQLSDGFDLIIQLGRNKEGKRVVTEITEIGEMEGETILSTPLAKWSENKLQATGFVSNKLGILEERAGLAKNFFNKLK